MHAVEVKRRNRRNTDHHRTCGVGRTRNGTTMASLFLLFLPLRQIRQTTRPWRNDLWRVDRVVGNGRCDHRHHPFVAVSKCSSCPRACTTMVEVNNRHNDDRPVVNPAKSSRTGRGTNNHINTATAAAAARGRPSTPEPSLLNNHNNNGSSLSQRSLRSRSCSRDSSREPPLERQQSQQQPTRMSTPQRTSLERQQQQQTPEQNRTRPHRTRNGFRRPW
jgi:hypothetical protein